MSSYSIRTKYSLVIPTTPCNSTYQYRVFVGFITTPSPRMGQRSVLSTTTYPIELFEVDIQQPLKATAFTLDPTPMERMTDNQGFTYHQFTYRDVGKGQSQTFTIAYTKTATTPSVSKQQPTPQPTEKARARSDNTLVALSIFAGAILLFAGCAWLMQRSQRQHMPATTAPAPSASMSDTCWCFCGKMHSPRRLWMCPQCCSKPG